MIVMVGVHVFCIAVYVHALLTTPANRVWDLVYAVGIGAFGALLIRDVQLVRARRRS